MSHRVLWRRRRRFRDDEDEENLICFRDKGSIREPSKQEREAPFLGKIWKYERKKKKKKIDNRIFLVIMNFRLKFCFSSFSLRRRRRRSRKDGKIPIKGLLLKIFRILRFSTFSSSVIRARRSKFIMYDKSKKRMILRSPLSLSLSKANNQRVLAAERPILSVWEFEGSKLLLLSQDASRSTPPNLSGQNKHTWVVYWNEKLLLEALIHSLLYV